MKVGVIARCEDRGLGIQTWEACRHLQPDQVLLVRMRPDHRAIAPHPHRYDPWPTTQVALSRAGLLDELAVRTWLAGLDVVYTAETWYDPRLAAWAAEAGCVVVCHVNPEFLTQRQAATPNVVWWAPTTWLHNRLPAATRVVPMPVATERFSCGSVGSGAPEPVLLHVAGLPAAGDRNGTAIFLEAVALMRTTPRVIVRTQAALPYRFPPNVVVVGNEANYWDGYAADVLVMPRRYGGLCLPVQEAAAAGHAVVTTDCAPNHSWPGLRVPVATTTAQHTPAGDVPAHHADPQALADVLDTLVEDGGLVAQLKADSRAWAQAHSWDTLLPLWRDELARATRTPRSHDASVSVLIPYAEDGPERAAALAVVRARYERLGWQVCVGTCAGPWRKGVALADAARQGTGAVYVVADADVWSSATVDAVQLVRSGACRWAIPHTYVRRLSPSATALALASEPYDQDDLDRPRYQGTVGGGIVVLDRELWERCPVDTRFVGWGGEDIAWGMALRKATGFAPKQLPTDLIHYWHPPQPRDEEYYGSRHNRMLLRQHRSR